MLIVCVLVCCRSRIKRRQPEAVAKHEERAATKEKSLSESVFKYIAAGGMASVISIGFYLSFQGLFHDK